MVDLATRFNRHIAKAPSGCWEWTASRDRHGYGKFKLGRETGAHRASHRLFKGPIPEGHCIDHLCRNPACVNPAHLEAVTHKENTLRGISFSAINARKRACIHGHVFDDRNTYRHGGKRRQCRKCNAAAVARYKARITVPMGLLQQGGEQ